jgi:hypothetical protein
MGNPSRRLPIANGVETFDQKRLTRTHLVTVVPCLIWMVLQIKQLESITFTGQVNTTLGTEGCKVLLVVIFTDVPSVSSEYLIPLSFGGKYTGIGTRSSSRAVRASHMANGSWASSVISISSKLAGRVHTLNTGLIGLQTFNDNQL